MTDATIGYLSQFWIDNRAGVLTELAEVRRIQMPNDATFEQIEATHLKSPDRRREYVRGFRTDREYEVEFNYVPNSPTDVIMRGLAGTDGTYAARIVEFDGFAQVATHDFDVRNVSFTISDIETEAVKMVTLTFRVASDVASTYP